MAAFLKMDRDSESIVRYGMLFRLLPLPIYPSYQRGWVETSDGKTTGSEIFKRRPSTLQKWGWRTARENKELGTCHGSAKDRRSNASGTADGRCRDRSKAGL